MRAARPSFALLATAALLASGVTAVASADRADRATSNPSATQATSNPSADRAAQTAAATAATAAATAATAATTPVRATPKPSPTPTVTPVPTPTPEPIPTEPVCTTGATSHGQQVDKLRGRVLRLEGVVEIRGTRTFLAVEACVGRNALPTQEFTLVKAPKTTRHVAVMTAIPTREPNGSISIAIAALAVPRTERQFRQLIPTPKVRLRLPGVKGVVFARPGTPLELLATHKNGKRIPQSTKQKAAKAYLLTGGTVSRK